MNNWQRIILMILFLVCVNVGSAWAQADSERTSVESATWRFEIDNDVLFDKDNQISSGWSVQKHSAVAKSWEDLEGLPKFIRQWGAALPTLTDEGLSYRAGIAVGQIIQTPDDDSRRDLNKDDVPYAGALTAQASWYAFNDDEFRGFELTLGVVGSPSLAEQTQKLAHKITGNDDPKGWDHQLKTEPVLNFNYMRKQKIWRHGNPADWAADVSVDGHAGLGNMFTQASVALECRWGYNMPRGFASVPDPIGLSMHYIAALTPANPQAGSFYTTLVLSGSAVAHNIFLDGNTFRDSHSVDKEPLVGLAVAGLHYERKNWGIHFNVVASTDDVDTDDAPDAEGHERLGSITVEWRF